MKKIVCLSILSFMLIATSAYAKSSENKEVHGNGYYLLRGVSNVGLGWLALPQEMMYQSVKLPVVGIISGVGVGTAIFIWRELGGLTDILSLGFDGGRNFFNQVPDFPWDAPWLPPEKNES